jgi:hypothetical protein
METMLAGTLGFAPASDGTGVLEHLQAERRRLADLAARYSAFGFEGLARECQERLADLRRQIRRCRRYGKEGI